MSNDFQAVQALRRSECGPLGVVGRRRGPTRGLRAGHHEEYAATVRRAFAPLGPSLVVLACQSAASGPTEQGAPMSAVFALATAPCFKEADGPAGAAPSGAVAPFELPEQVAQWALDRCAPPHAYGELGSESLERACERVLGPGCRAEERAGLRRVLRFRYLSRADRTGSVDGVLSRFQDVESAYAHFTRVVVGDEDPALLTATPFDGGSLVQRGDGLFACRGREMLWLQRVDEGTTALRREQAALDTLPGLARSILAALGAPDALPAAVQQLPQLARIPLGVRLLLGEAFGVAGIGPSALGYYQEGSKRWRVAAVVRPDAESAKDVMSTLEQQADARRIDNAPLEALKLSERGAGSEPALSWVIGRRAEVVVGVADEEAPTLARRELGPSGLSVQEKWSKLLGATGR
jgi:hypothetical protein